MSSVKASGSHKALYTKFALAALTATLAGNAAAQSGTPYWMTHGGNQQHTQQAPAASQNITSILWHKPVDLAPNYQGGELFIHYADPLISHNNTVLMEVRKGFAEDGTTDVFKIEARDGATGNLKWSATSDYIAPAHSWTPVFGGTLTFDGHLAWPAIGGTVQWRSEPDNSGTALKRYSFFGGSNYNADRADYNAHVFIDTPISTDNRGQIYFGFVVTGDTPLHLRGGLAKISPNGGGQYIFADDATGDSDCNGVAMNCAPAVSADGKYVYVCFKRAHGGGYLTAINTYEMTEKYNHRLFDPNSGNDALIAGESSAAPMIGPDGDVYFGILENPFTHHDRGWLLHFDKTLTTEKTPGSFGWDIMPSMVPASSVPSYMGSSTYLLMCKYNNYAGVGGDGVNKIAILDPNAAETDPVDGNLVMNEVMSIAGPTPDPEFRDSSHPNAVREWCINAACVDNFNKCVLAGSEDGILYRWDLTTNTLSQSRVLNAAVGEAYTPTVVGPTGIVYAINNATLYACGVRQP